MRGSTWTGTGTHRRHRNRPYKRREAGILHCIYCGHPVGENTKQCGNCGAQLTLLDKWRGQHVRRADLLSADTFLAAAASALLTAAVFLPLCAFKGGEEAWALSRGVAGTGAWFPVLDLIFTVIFLSAWFLGEKSRHYFRTAASGAAGCWLLCAVFTLFMAAARANGDSLTLQAGYFLWLAGLGLQAAAVILYGRRTKILNERRQ